MSKEIIQKFKESITANGLAASTIISYMNHLKNADNFKPLESWNSEILTAYQIEIQKKFKPSTQQSIKIVLKVFFKWSGRNDLLKEIKIKTSIAMSPIKDSEILTVDDVNFLIDNAGSMSLQALIAVLFESGGRIMEVLKIKMEDIEDTPTGLYITLTGTKTGTNYRKNIYIFAANYVRNLMDMRKGEKYLFRTQLTGGANRQLYRLKNRTGFKKPLHCHVFRHAKTLYMQQLGFNETMIKHALGWSKESRMLSRYGHTQDIDLINATIEKTAGHITQTPITDLKTAERRNIADNAAIISKQSEEITQLKAALDKQKTQGDLILELLKEKGIVP